MKKKRSVLKDLLFVSLSSFIVAAAWVGFNIYHTHVTTTITPELQIQISAINPDFDSATIQKLKARKQVAPITTLSGKTVSTEPTVAPNQPGTPTVTGTLEPQVGEITSPTPTTTIGTQPQPNVTDIPVTVQGL